MVIFDLAKQVAQYFSSSQFKELLQADADLKVSQSAYSKTEGGDLRTLQQETQDMCCKLFEKVYSVFISHLKTKIYPSLARVFSDIPKPLKEDDLEFSNNENQEEDENPKTFSERLETWKGSHIEGLFADFIPACVREFNEDFQSILSKMTLEHLIDPAQEMAKQPPPQAA